MSKRHISILLLCFTVFLANLNGASEETNSRPDKKEVTDLMLKISQMSSEEQQARLDAIQQDPRGSKTPRSDFLFCMGLAYLGNAKAQACVARAYEEALGIVEDLSEAYTWYAIASETGYGDESKAREVEEARDKAKERLMSAYPHPTEEELDDMVNAQKARIIQYREEMKKK